MYVVLGATFYILIYNIIHTNTQYINTTPTTTTTTTTTTTNVTNTTMNLEKLTPLERSLLESDVILQQLQETIEDTKLMMKEYNFTIDDNIHDIRHYKENYGNILARLLSNESAARGPGDSRRHKELKLHLFDFVSLSNKKKKHKETEREMNRIMMQGKIDEWLLNRELEKKKIKNYIDRVKVAHLEKCPRQGLSNKRKRKKTRRRHDEDEKEDKKKRRDKKKKKKSKYLGGKQYPCCRKCCKRSYMGCL